MFLWTLGMCWIFQFNRNDLQLGSVKASINTVENHKCHEADQTNENLFKQKAIFACKNNWISLVSILCSVGRCIYTHLPNCCTTNLCFRLNSGLPILLSMWCISIDSNLVCPFYPWNFETWAPVFVRPIPMVLKPVACSLYTPRTVQLPPYPV